MSARFAAAALASAALLFVVEPLVAKAALPALGGSPAVWNGCMLFFQAALLAGYLYAHLLARRAPWRVQVGIHAAVLALPLLTLPLRSVGDVVPPRPDAPLAWLLASLTVTVGPAFVVLSSTAPLLGRWLGEIRGTEGRDPYWLYAASNAGSFVGLLAYPVVVEPLLSLRTQRLLWSAAYVLAALLSLACGLPLLRMRGRPAPERTAGTRSSARERLLWVALAAVPSSAMLGTTQHITTDVAAIPLLWVVPLGIYLLTFVVAFARSSRTPPRFLSTVLAVLAVAVVASLSVYARAAGAWLLPLHLLALLVLGLVLHGELARRRPHQAELTTFSLLIAVGGVAGGAFNALLAPRLFESVLEYPLVLLVACLLRPMAVQRPRIARELAIAAVAVVAVVVASFAIRASLPPSLQREWAAAVAVPVAACLPLVRWRVSFALALTVLLAVVWLQTTGARSLLYARRTFFGVHRVHLRTGPAVGGGPGLPFHVLSHGSTRHGAQPWTAELRRLPTSYYHPTGPIGRVLTAVAAEPAAGDVGIVGLGVGTLAAYGRPGQTIRVYEIDPEVVRIARTPRWFTYLADTRARVETVLGDGRLSLARERAGRFRVLVVDAFSSDAIPVHLLTREAVATYVRALAGDGVLAIHLTNLHLDLVPVVDGIARELDLVGLWVDNEVETEQQLREGKAASRWAFLARGDRGLAPVRAVLGGSPLPSGAQGAPWTDDWSNLLSVLRSPGSVRGPAR